MDFKLKNIVLRYYGFYFKNLVLSSLLIVNFFCFPLISNAGVISFVSSIFVGKNASAQSEQIIESNSQNMSLPEPAVNFDLVSRVENGIIIDGGVALLADGGQSVGKSDDIMINHSKNQINVYTVRSGDTLSKIAEMYDISVSTILWANDMTRSSVIKEGQNLVILPISGVLHKVVSGDTLSRIAKKYDGDLEEIANFNDLKISAVLSVGDTIMIPDGQMSSSIRPSASVGNSSSLVSSSGASYDGYYIKPFSGGRRTQGIHGYNAVDYGMPVGTTLRAAASGTVLISKSSGWNGGYGNYVVIKHPNNTQTVYAHMSTVSVSVGEKVSQGQVIGASGNTVKSTGPHLHFEVRGAKNPF